MNLQKTRTLTCTISNVIIKSVLGVSALLPLTVTGQVSSDWSNLSRIRFYQPVDHGISTSDTGRLSTQDSFVVAISSTILSNSDTVVITTGDSLLYEGSMKVPYESAGKMISILRCTDKWIPLVINIKRTNQYASLLINPSFTSVLIQFEKEFSTAESEAVHDHLPKYSLIKSRSSDRYGQINVFYYAGYRDFYDPSVR